VLQVTANSSNTVNKVTCITLKIMQQYKLTGQ